MRPLYLLTVLGTLSSFFFACSDSSGDAATTSSNDSGGCSVASPGGSAPAGLGCLALLGLAFGGRRRRR